MTPDDAQDYLSSFSDWERGTSTTDETYTLDRMHRLLDLLGRPDRACPLVHVVGTKGKGSTAAMISAVLRDAGYRTGLFVSPHLVSPRERYSVDGMAIDPFELASIVGETLQPAVERLRAAGERVPLHFELQCALAFAYFRWRGVDVAVVEAGLGGRLDATNAVSTVAVSVVTTLGYDHMAVLGGTLAEIAAEKAAVIRQGGLVACAPQLPQALAVVEHVCAARGARLEAGGRDWYIERVEEEPASTSFDLRTSHASYPRLRVALAGAHQAVNGGAAVAALELLRRRFPRLDEAAIRRGLASVAWPGRLQIAAREPLVLLDGAHNRESAAALAGAVQRLYPGQRFVLVAGMFADKDAESIVAPLLAVAGHIVITAPDHPRALPAATLAAQTRALGATVETYAAAGTAAPGVDVEEAPSVALALARARRLAGTQGCVLVTGSLRMVGEAMIALGIDPLTEMTGAGAPRVAPFVDGAGEEARRLVEDRSPAVTHDDGGVVEPLDLPADTVDGERVGPKGQARLTRQGP